MSKATVYSGAQWGAADETTASGLIIGTINYNGTSETAELPNHFGCATGLAVYNPKKDVSGDGVVATKGTGLVGDIGAVIALANSTYSSRTRNDEGLGVTPNANAGVIITGNTLSPQQSGFETGGFSGIFLPGVATNAAVSITS